MREVSAFAAVGGQLCVGRRPGSRCVGNDEAETEVGADGWDERKQVSSSQQEVLELAGLLFPIMLGVVLESVAGEGALRKARPGGGTSK